MSKPNKTPYSAPAPPEWLNEQAKLEWARVLAGGFACNGAAQETVLSAYCQNYARWVQAEKLLEEFGTEISLRDDKGNVKNVIVSPQVGISNKAFDRMLKAAGQLDLRANLSKSDNVPALRSADLAELFGTLN